MILRNLRDQLRTLAVWCFFLHLIAFDWYTQTKLSNDCVVIMYSNMKVNGGEFQTILWVTFRD